MKIRDQLNDQQKREWNKQWEVLSYGVSSIIPDEEFKEKIAKSIPPSSTVEGKAWAGSYGA
ncbi:hypothetical protein BN982_02514 [Halobacillus karajensis]|uniref:Uncharacterized protein n=1 Tax=Halobacillus karajensis TaxID=195088 RepID=A0A024P885_9BACI|nr:hypothetical protein BN982_02514 [Halobacillus karajensis]CDQ25145.1 hypothetical protein BN983_03451 [Halobacillus karajensis]CDQ28494.1 hypothetical protein BN981_02801 [Halobacillus karajensis]